MEGISRTIGYLLVLAFLIPIVIMPTIATPSLNQPQSQEFLTWNEPQGDFSVEYPSDWTVKEKENQYDNASDVTFTSPHSAINGYVGIDYEDTTVEEFEALIESGFDESEILERAFDAFIKRFRPSIDNFREVENKDFSKYTINGEPAASIVFAGEIYGQGIGGLLVVSFVNDRIFNLGFGASQGEFDKILPTVEHMISSIQVPAAA
jgi:PsbP-like protein